MILQVLQANTYTVKTRWESSRALFSGLQNKMTDKTKPGVWKAKLTEQKHRFDVLDFLSEQCMNGTDEEMGRVGSYNIKYKYVFFIMWFFL